MRALVPAALLLTAGCAGTLYGHFAGPAAGTADEAYQCVQAQMKTLGYNRIQFDAGDRWFVGQKTRRENNPSGLYRHTVEVLDTKVTPGKDGAPSLDIKARTYQEFATARGEDRQEAKASSVVQNDARTLGRACAAQ